MKKNLKKLIEYDMRIELPNNWKRRDDQYPLMEYMWDGGKRAVMVAHRRWGKDDCSLHFTATALIERVGNYWHMLPKYEQARKVIWSAVNPKTGQKRIDEAFPKELRKRTLENEMKIEFKNGSTWQLVGSDNYNQYVGSQPLGIVMSEYSISNPMAWAYIAPILEQNDGWAIFIYTPRGNNHGKTMYLKAKNDPNWFAELITAKDSPVFTPQQLENIKSEYSQLWGAELGEALFNQEYMCSFDSAQLGAFYAKQLAKAREEKRITKVPYDPAFEVYTAWDLGVDDSTSIWFFQVIGPCFYFIDYYENVAEGPDHYAKILKEKKYNYGDHYLPHDADHRKFVEGARSPKQILENLGVEPIKIVERAKDTITVMQHIQQCRLTLAKCYFDENNCNQGLIALESYRAEYDDTKKKLQNHPLHDWTSHSADSFRTFAIGYKERTTAMTAEQYYNSVGM